MQKQVECTKTPAVKRESNAQRRRKTIKLLYINSAVKIIREEGSGALNIRRIAAAVGYNSATLYTYFEDVEELLIYCTFKLRKEYLRHLAREINTDMTLLEQYIKLYEIYCYYAFDEPEIYFNMYFGKYSDKLYRIRDSYYELFADEAISITPLIDSILWAPNVYEGEKAATRTLAEHGFIKPENADMVAAMIVRIHSSYMHDMMINKCLSCTLMRHEFLTCLMHVIDTNR